jgi:L-asparaginase/Glu-tRNA(Gln) amidotransferase subunit D
VRPRASSKLSLATAVERNVVLIKLTPNMEPDTLARFLEGAAGAVLEGTGAGHIRTSLQPIVADFKKPAVITTQTVYGGEHLGAYDIDRKILAISNIIPVADMTSETALVKLMWALAQGGDVRSTMRTSLAGEISDLTDSTLGHH